MPTCVQVSWSSTCKRNGSECPCAPGVVRGLEDGEFSVNTAFF